MLIRSQTKRYLDDRQARNTGSVSFRKTSDAIFNGLKIRGPRQIRFILEGVLELARAQEERDMKI